MKILDETLEKKKRAEEVTGKTGDLKPAEETINLETDNVQKCIKELEEGTINFQRERKATEQQLQGVEKAKSQIEKE